MSSHPRVAVLAVSLALLAACSDPPAGAPPASEAPAAAPVAAVPTDEAGLRQAVREAMANQRVYAPAGDNAIEYYLALRDLRPEQPAIGTALMELLPYAVIASEQAVGREDFAEARRLLGLIERADASAPALARLRDSIAAAEASAARRLIAEAEAAKLREVQAAQQAAAERERALAGQAVAEPSAPAPPVAAPVPAATVPSATSAPSAAARPEAAGAAASAEVPPTGATAVPAAREPTLVSAPPPRYPLTALRRKLEGQVTLEFTVQPDGSVSGARVVSADPPGVFDEAALVAVSRWRFEPVPRAVTTRRQLQFRP